MLCLATSAGQVYVHNFLTFLSVGDNTSAFFAHLSGMLATIVLSGMLAIVASLLHMFMKRSSRYDRVLAALRLTLKNDPNASVHAEAAKGLAELDVEESALHQQHEALDDLLVSTLEGEQKDFSPGVRSKVVEGLTNLKLEQHSYQHTQNQLDDLLFEQKP